MVDGSERGDDDRLAGSRCADFAQLAEQAWERRAEERDHAPRKPITPDALEEDEAGCE